MTSGDGAAAHPVLKLNQGDPSEARIYYCVHFVAEALGYFSDEGIRVEFQTAAGGGRTVRGGQIPALVEGRADLTVGGPMVAMRMLEDGEARLVSFCAVANGNPWVLAGVDPADRPALAELKGRSIIDVANVGTATMAFRWLAARAGISEDELDLRPGSGDEVADLEAVASGRIDYALHSLHALAPALAEGRLHLALDLADGTGALPWSAYLARPERISEMRDVFAAFVRAIARAQDWMAHHSGAEVTTLIAPAYPSYPQEALAFGLQIYLESGVLPTDPLIRPGEFERFAGLLKDIGWLRRPAPFDALVDTELARQAGFSDKAREARA